MGRRWETQSGYWYFQDCLKWRKHSKIWQNIKCKKHFYREILVNEHNVSPNLHLCVIWSGISRHFCCNVNVVLGRNDLEFVVSRLSCSAPRYTRKTYFYINPLALQLGFYSLAHHLCKMWIFYDPSRLTLGNTRHFVEELTKIVTESLKKIIKYICWLNI